MAQIIINEQGVRQLSIDMLQNMRQIAQRVSEIEGMNSTLRAALGDDYMAIARSVNVMSAELENAQRELNIIIDDMNEYMARVQQARVSLG